MSSNTFHIRGIDNFDDAIRIIDNFSDSEVTLQEEENDIDPDLDGDLDAYNNMQTLTSTADAEVCNEVDEDFDEDGFAASHTPRAPVHVCGRDAGHRRPRRRGQRNVRSRSPHGFVGFFGSNKSMTEHTDNLLKGLDHKKGTQIMLHNWTFFKIFLLVMFGNFFVK